MKGVAFSARCWLERGGKCDLNGKPLRDKAQRQFFKRVLRISTELFTCKPLKDKDVRNLLTKKSEHLNGK